MSSLLNERLDQLLVSAFLAPVQLGLYVIAVTATSVTSLVGSSVSPVAAAQIAHMEEAEVSSAARRLVAFTFWVSLAVTLPVIVFTSPLISVLFGSGFASVRHVAQLLLVGAVFLSTNRTLTAVLNGLGRPLDAAVAEGIAVACTLLLLATLLPTIGLLGAGVASVIAYGVSTLWMARRVSTLLGIRPYQLFVSSARGARRNIPASRAPALRAKSTQAGTAR